MSLKLSPVALNELTLIMESAKENMIKGSSDPEMVEMEDAVYRVVDALNFIGTETLRKYNAEGDKARDVVYLSLSV